MFQITVMRDVVRAIQQRIDAVERNVRDDMRREELESSRTTLIEIANNITSLRPALSLIFIKNFNSLIGNTR